MANGTGGSILSEKANFSMSVKLDENFPDFEGNAAQVEFTVNAPQLGVALETLQVLNPMINSESYLLEDLIEAAAEPDEIKGAEESADKSNEEALMFLAQPIEGGREATLNYSYKLETGEAFDVSVHVKAPSFVAAVEGFKRIFSQSALEAISKGLLNYSPEEIAEAMSNRTEGDVQAPDVSE